MFDSNKAISLPIEGMTCASCVARIENKLKKVNGIKIVNVNLATEKAYIEYDSNLVKINSVKKTIEEIGYKVVTISENTDTDDYFIKSQKKFKIDLIIALAFSFIVVSISMTMMLMNDTTVFGISENYLNYFLLINTLPVIFWSGRKFFIKAYKNLIQLTSDMNTLVALGTGTAFIYSVLIIFFPHIFHYTSVGHQGVYFDTTVSIITLILLGKYLESRAKTKTSEAIRKLIELKPKTANLFIDNNIISIKIDDLKLDDIVLVKPGEKIPADGIVVSGSTSIDESMLTGESIPVDKKESDGVFAGTQNKFGSFTFKVTKSEKDSMLGQIIKLVESAQGTKAPIQNLADKIASIFVPIVILISVLTFLIWYFVVGVSFSSALINFVSVLIIACPCALGLATPTAIIVATGIGAKSGILIKSSECLEKASKISAVVFDKTGTITEGEPSVQRFIPYTDNEMELYQIVLSVERFSEHPLSNAIINYFHRAKFEYLTIDFFETIPGIGVRAKLENKTVIIGNYKIFELAEIHSKIDVPMLVNPEDTKNKVFVIYDDDLKALITFSDKIKPSSKIALEKLKNIKMELLMISGDGEEETERIAAEVGIVNYHSNVLPSDKQNHIIELQKKGHLVCMVGDGINDAPALATADVGIAMGKGTDIAMESSQIVLLKNDLKEVFKVINLSKITMKVIKSNLFWAFFYNIICIPLAAFGLLNPMIAAGAMAISSVSVIINSLSIKGKNLYI